MPCWLVSLASILVSGNSRAENGWSCHHLAICIGTSVLRRRSELLELRHENLVSGTVDRVGEKKNEGDE